MFIDTRRLDEGHTVEAELCIIGGGVAGITLALEFEKRGIDTCLIESGGFKPDRATRDLYRGESVGIPYRFADGCRSRYLGGSSNCWGGWCRPMEESDFDQRAWVANSGWPFGKAELQAYYERTHTILQIGPNRFDTDFWVDEIDNPAVRKIPFDPAFVVDGVSQFSPPARFGKLYREDLARSRNVKVYLYANAVDIESDESGRIDLVRAKTLTGNSATFTAKIFVLAAGGIENARLLLVSNQQRTEGLGNHNDLVGRYFMDHPRLYSGKVRFNPAWAHNMLYDIKHHYQNKSVAAHGTCIAAQFGLPFELQAKEKLLNARVCFSSVFPGEDSDVATALIHIKQMLERKEQFERTLVRDMLALARHPSTAAGFLASRFLPTRSLAKYARFQIVVEPLPDPDSRVTLSDQRDRLGLRRVKVDWRIDTQVKRTIDRTLAIIARDLTRAGVAEVELDPAIEGGDWPSTFEKEGTWHHMGTTRMHDSQKLGVVDRNCRVHGTANLYAAGSSVFPTGGGNFPTITICALALRLSDHIAVEIQRTRRVALAAIDRSVDEVRCFATR
jgi:choline dehydrogenase-like flavoprotein